MTKFETFHARLESEFKSFWLSHDYNQAMILISKMRSFWGSDFSIYTNENILKGLYLYVGYVGRNNLNWNNIDVSKINYQFLINNFSDYWNLQAKNITDYKKRLEALNTVSWFKKITGSFINLVSILTDPILIFGIGIFLLYYLKE